MTCYKIAFYYSKALESHPYASTQEKGTDDYDEMTYSSEIGRSWQASKLIIKKFLKETLSLSLSQSTDYTTIKGKILLIMMSCNNPRNKT